MIRSFDGTTPEIADSAYVDPAATVVGDVRLAADASVWPGAVLRGDSGRIVLGERANVQDNATLHEETTLEADATVGHNAIVHDATVGEASIVGMGAVVLDGARVGADSIVAANSTVTEDTEIPAGVLAAGAPASVVRELDGDGFAETAHHYAGLGTQYAETSEVVEDGASPPE